MSTEEALDILDIKDITTKNQLEEYAYNQGLTRKETAKLFQLSSAQFNQRVKRISGAGDIVWTQKCHLCDISFTKDNSKDPRADIKGHNSSRAHRNKKSASDQGHVSPLNINLIVTDLEKAIDPIQREIQELKDKRRAAVNKVEEEWAGRIRAAEERLKVLRRQVDDIFNNTKAEQDK